MAAKPLQNEKKRKLHRQIRIVVIGVLCCCLFFYKNAFYSNGTKATPYATSFSPPHKDIATQNGNEYKRKTQTLLYTRRNYISCCFVCQGSCRTKGSRWWNKRFLPRAKLERKKLERWKKWYEYKTKRCDTAQHFLWSWEYQRKHGVRKKLPVNAVVKV